MKLDSTLPSQLEKLRDSTILTNKEEIIKKLSTLLTNAVKNQIPKNQKIAIAFSGGVDSCLLAFICGKLNIPFTLYAIGFQGAKDLDAAESAAELMNWPIEFYTLTKKLMPDVFKEIIDITKKQDVVTVGVGTVTYSVCKAIKEEILITGLGSEELFAGYERHKGNINEECWKGLLDIWERDIKRDLPLAQHFKKKLILPFLDKELVEYAMKIDGKLKVGEYRKQILREAAKKLGLPEELAYRKKRAAQYGSKTDYILEKLAKEKAMTKREYLSEIANN